MLAKVEGERGDMVCYILESSLEGQKGQEDVGCGLVQSNLAVNVMRKVQVEGLRRPTWMGSGGAEVPSRLLNVSHLRIFH